MLKISDNKALVLFKALFKRHIIELRSYAVNTLLSLISAYLIFLFLFLGIQSLAGRNNTILGETLPGIVIGYMLWFLAVSSYSSLPSFLIQEAYQGTLEQLAMSPLGLDRVLLFRMCISLIFNLGISLTLLFVMMASTGKWLHLDFGTILPLLLLTVIGVQGIGFIIGGLALLFKQVQASFTLLQFLFAALIVAPLDLFSFVAYLPLSWGTAIIRRVMIEERSFLEIPSCDLLFLLANSVFYFGLGFFIFKICERTARDQGLLGHY